MPNKLANSAINVLSTGNFWFARVCAFAAIKVYPTDWQSFYAMGQVLSLSGQRTNNQQKMAAAVAHLHQAVELGPAEETIWLALGIAYQQLQRWSESIDSLGKALQLDPDYAAAYNSLGYTQLKTGDFNKAAYNFKAALAALVRVILRGSKNDKDARRFVVTSTPHNLWADPALYGASFVSARDNCPKIAVPDNLIGEQGDQNPQHGGLLWIDELSNGEIRRRFLLNYFAMMSTALLKHHMYPPIMFNLSEASRGLCKETLADQILEEVERSKSFQAIAGSFEHATAAYERQDYATAMRLLLPLVDQGIADAQYNLGVMYYKGQGVPQDYAEAVKWFRKAADQGKADAQNNLGVMYAEGQGVPQDYAEAAKWYRKAADQGIAEAQNNLAHMYAEGQGVPQDYAEAAKWYRKAADQGIADAQNNLGSMYAHGQGVPQDDAEAVRWYRKAADQGYASAQNNLGGMYANGRGVPKDYGQARNWYNLAAAQGFELAKQELSTLPSN